MSSQRLFAARLALAAILSLAIGACQPSTPPPPTATLPPPRVYVEAPTAVAATETPSVTAAPSAFGPTGFPADMDPLTGETVTDVQRLERRPLAIKVANSPRSIRQFQSGLSLADLVFEHIAEGGNTRLTAVFLSRDATVVGPNRSARLIDIELMAMYKAAFAFSGASAGTRERILHSPVVAQAFSENGAGCPPLCRVDPDNFNNLMADTAALSRLATERGLPNGRQDLDGLRFDLTPAEGGDAGTTVTLRYSSESWTEWRYDRASGRYRRWADASATELKPLFDALTGQPITAANVVVLWVPTIITDILEDDEGFDPTTGAGGHYGVQIQLWNTGPALIFRDGLAYHATWVRLESDGTLGLVDADGQHVPLKPGNTWFQLIGALSDGGGVNAVWTFNHKQP